MPGTATGVVASLPTEFAIFPLSGALLLPHGKLPLNVFEPRYLRMVDDALGAAGRVIGMIQGDVTRPATPSGPATYRIGCLGRVTSFSETDDGRYLITLTGMTRFAVQVELEEFRGYRRVRADLARFEDDLTEPDEAAVGAVGDRARLLGALRAYFGIRGFDANWDVIEQMPDTDLVRTLAMVCPFEPPEKQALLEAPGPAEQGAVLLALLEMGAHDAESRRAT